MNEREFCYWLQGFFELSDPAYLSATQTEVIKEHLKLVFRKETKEIILPIKNNPYLEHRDSIHPSMIELNSQFSGQFPKGSC